MFVGAADEDYIAAFESLVADVDIGRDVGPRKVAQVQWTVRVWERRRHEDFFRHNNLRRSPAHSHQCSYYTMRV